MDNLSLHIHKEVTDRANRRRRLTIHFTPTYASWLSQVEIWFNIFSKDVIRGGVWKSKKQMIDQIMHYIRHYTEHRAHPFAWTYTGKPLVA
jgi:putative transposase